MAGKPQRPVEEWIDKAVAMRADGRTYAEIAALCGVCDDTVRNHIRKHQFRRAAKAEPQHVPQQQQDLAAEIEAMRQAAQRVTPVIEAPAVDMRQVWQQYETANAATILKVQARREFRWSIPGNEPFAIAFPSDQHISLGPVDMRQMRIDAECIASTPRMACVLVGDGVDNHIKHRSAVLAATDTPDMQWMLYEHYLTLLRESIACIAAGNHDAFSKQIGGVDMVAKMAAAQKLCYTPDEAYLTAELGGVEYVIGVRHQYRMNSSFNQTHSVKQWLRNGMKPFDIGVIGHHHEHAQETAWIMGRMRWFARPGSYQITSGYAAQYGFNDAMPTTPTVVIYPQERQIVGFDTCHKAAKWLRAEGVS